MLDTVLGFEHRLTDGRVGATPSRFAPPGHRPPGGRVQFHGRSRAEQQDGHPADGRGRPHHPEQHRLHGDPGAVREGTGKPRVPGGPGLRHLQAFSLRTQAPLSCTQGVVIGTGERSQFGEVFKMMQAEEVRAVGLWVCGSWGLRGFSAGDTSPACSLGIRMI